MGHAVHYGPGDVPLRGEDPVGAHWTDKSEAVAGCDDCLELAAVKGDGMGLLKKSAPLNVGEKRVFNVIESREVMLTNGKKVQQLSP